MAKRADALAALEGRIGYSFTDRALLDQALTHASASKATAAAADNERLEFLGDRVLGLLAAEALIARDPRWREGELSRRHAALVSGSACAQAARRLDIGAALRLAGGAASQGGRANERIVGDAMEAVIAAVYLDGGAAAARSLFERAWSHALAALSGAAPKDAKSVLQEWAMARGLPLPAYRLLARSGPDHAPSFTVAAAVSGHAPASGAGGSLQAAEKAAAAAFLAREGEVA